MAKPKSPPDAATALSVTARRDGFRRAGRAWSVQPTTVPLAELSDDQVAQLRAEPMLTVEDVTE